RRPVGRAGWIASAWTEASSRSTIKTTLYLTLSSTPHCFVFLRKYASVPLRISTKAQSHEITIVLFLKSADAALRFHAWADL
ncbi:MAG TPA: hypothetical protein PLN91_14770, partial [Rhodanobacteraceae bacterium]|nr:hypothetical protein [Rhodanobacteraceae bacterium]